MGKDLMCKMFEWLYFIQHILILSIICLYHNFLPEACRKNISHLFMVSLPHEGISYKIYIIKNVLQNLCKLFLITIRIGARIVRS